MKKEFIVERQGRAYILYAGLLSLAHEQGLKSIRTTLVQVPSEANNRVAICTAMVTVEKDGIERVFSGIGDAAPNNVAPAMQNCLVRMAECVPLSARILTRDGWKGYDAVSIGDEVLAYDVEADRCRWTPLRDISVYEDDFITLRMRSRSFDVTCTPNHTWAIAPQRMQRRLREAQLLTEADKIVVAALAEDGDSPLSAREAAILGWIATEGTIRQQTVDGEPYRRVFISPSEPTMVAKLRGLLADDASVRHCKGEYPRTFPSGETVTCLPSYKFELRSDFARRLLERAGFTTFAELPSIVTRLSHEARQAMLEAMLDGDSFKASSSATRLFAQKAKPGVMEGVMEAFEILALLEGRALGSPRFPKSGNLPLRAVRSKRLISATTLRLEPGEPQPVWCPTTDYGTWVMNLNGTITITGNTRAKARALRDAVNVGMAAFEEMSEEDAHDGSLERGHTVSTGRTVRVPLSTAARAAGGNGGHGNAAPAGRQNGSPKPQSPAEGVPLPTELRNPITSPITETQREAIRSQCRRHGLEGDAVAREKFGVETLTDLNQAQASELIRALNERNTAGTGRN